MADNSKKDVIASTETESEASAKVAKAAKKGPAKAKKTGPSAGSRLKKYLKDVKGETKKIIWPDAKTVFKSTGVVLLVVIICALIIWGIDTGLTAGVSGLKSLAQGTTETTETADGEDAESADGEKAEGESAESEDAKTEEAADTTDASESQDTSASEEAESADAQE